MAKACEDAGFDCFWIAEAYPWWRKHQVQARSSTAILAVIAPRNEKIQLGWELFLRTRVTRFRSPWKRARHAGSCRRDRFLLRLGASKIFMKEIGEGEGRRLGQQPSCARALRSSAGVLKGDAFEYREKFSPPVPPPLKSDAHIPRGIPPIYVDGYRPGAAEIIRRHWRRTSHGIHNYAAAVQLFKKEHAWKEPRRQGKTPSNLILGCVIVGRSAATRKGKRGCARGSAAMYPRTKCRILDDLPMSHWSLRD